MRPIRVLVVEDSIVFRELLVQNLNRDPAIQVVATAKDPFEARDFSLQARCHDAGCGASADERN